MRIIQKNIFTNHRGATALRDILVTAVVTLTAAVIIIVFFIVVVNRSGRSPALPGTIPQSQNEGQKPSQQNQQPGTETPADTRQTYRGVLTSLSADTLVVTEKETQKRITIALNKDTVIKYNEHDFSRSQLYIGDQVEIIAETNTDPPQAENILVVVSASPSEPAPLPKTPDTRPDGNIKPL